MSALTDNSAALIDQIRRKAPEYLDLMTATTEEEFEKAFDALLGPAVARLEENKKALVVLDEDGLSSFLGASLSIPGLTVSRERHSNGHVDLTIEADHCVPPRKKLGEAKIYSGAAYHYKGLEQLIGRYSTGREGRGLLIEYFRQKDIAGCVIRLRKRMDAEKPHQQQGKTVDHVLRWSFISTHTLTSGDDHEIAHIGCNLCAE